MERKDKELVLMDIMIDMISEDYTEHQSINLILKNMNDVLGTDVGILSKIVDDVYIVKAASSIYVPGDTFNIKDTYCNEVCKTKSIVYATNIGQSDCVLKSHPLYKKQKLETYIACPVFVDGQFYGTFNFSGKAIREPFCPREIELVTSLAKHVEKLIKGAKL